MNRIKEFFIQNKMLSIFVLIILCLLLVVCFISNKILLLNFNSTLSTNQISSILLFMFTIGYTPLLIAIKQKYILDQNIAIKKTKIILISIVGIVLFYIAFLLIIFLTLAIYFFFRRSIGDTYLFKHFNIVLVIYFVSTLPYLVIIFLYNYLYDHLLLYNELKENKQKHLMLSVYKNKLIYPFISIILFTIHLVCIQLFIKYFYGIFIIFVTSIVNIYWGLLSTKNYVLLIELNSNKKNT